MKYKLFVVSYLEWNQTFSDKHLKKTLSAGIDEQDAISLVRQEVSNDASDFKAYEINEVMGHRVVIQ